MCPSFPIGFEGGVWDLIVLNPFHCLSIYFSNDIHCSDKTSEYSEKFDFATGSKKLFRFSDLT